MKQDQFTEQELLQVIKFEGVMFRYGLSLSFLLFLNFLFAQSDFIITNTAVINVEAISIIAEEENTKYIRVIDKGTSTLFYPGDIVGFGFADGKEYTSKNVVIGGYEKNVFLQRLEKGQLNLYYYPQGESGLLYIEKDDQNPFELPKGKEELRALMSDLMSDMVFYKKQTKVMTEKVGSVSKLISLYNSDQKQPLPFIRYGIMFGSINSRMRDVEVLYRNLTYYPDDDEYQYFFNQHKVEISSTSGMSLGCFVDVPMAMTYFTVNASTIISNNVFMYHNESQYVDLDVSVERLSLEVPLQVRYTLPSRVLRPFVNVGTVFVQSLDNNQHIYSTTKRLSVRTTEEYDQNRLLATFNQGYVIGFGFNVHVDPRRVVSAELRHSGLIGAKNGTTVNNTQILFSISL